MNKPITMWEQRTFIVKYYDNGLIEYCDPNTEKVLFSKQTPTGKSPVVIMNAILADNEVQE